MKLLRKKKTKKLLDIIHMGHEDIETNKRDTKQILGF